MNKQYWGFGQSRIAMYNKCSIIIVLVLIPACICSIKDLSYCPDCCHCDQDISGIRIECSCTPTIIPNKTTYASVQVHHGAERHLSIIHRSWSNVKTLKIHNNNEGTLITKDTFLGLQAIEELHVSSFYSVEEIPTGTFGHLYRLKTLDLSNNLRLKFSGLSSMFPDLQNMSLDLLNLSRTNRYNRVFMGMKHLDLKYIKTLTKLKVKCLDISWVGYILFNLSGVANYMDLEFSHMEVLNMSYSKLVVTVNKKLDVYGNRFDLLFPRLKQINAEGVESSYYDRLPVEDCMKNLGNFPFDTFCANIPIEQHLFLPPFLESANFNGFVVRSGTCLEMRPTHTNCFNNNNLLKTFSMKNAGITGWNLVTVSLNNLETLDLRYNRIKVITNISLRYIPNLKRLLLGSNSLWKYQNNVSFENILNYSTELQEMDLSKNNLSVIPRFLFSRNSKLRIIDLSFNKLTNVAFDIGHLLTLKLLNLSSNDLSAITDFSLRDIKFISTTNISSFIDLTHNNIVCSCRSKMFIKTLQDISSSLIGYSSYQCYYKTSVVKINSIDEVILNRDCILEIVTIVGSVLCPILLVAVASIVMYRNRVQFIKLYVRYRFWRYRKWSAHVVDRVFLAYSHHDKDLVLGNIYPELNTRLKQYLKTDRDVLYINDRDFALPGEIDEEIVRAVLSCKCTLALVSRRFVESAWTHLEIAYSWAKKRPIILVFLDNLEEDELHGILRYLYNKNVRLEYSENTREDEVFWTKLLGGLVRVLRGREYEGGKNRYGEGGEEDRNREEERFNMGF